MFNAYIRDKDSAIKGLQVCRSSGCDSCPYQDIGCSPVLAYDVLVLLDERSAVPVRCMVGEGNTNRWECSACHAPVFNGDKFCRICGRELIWKQSENGGDTP